MKTVVFDAGALIALERRDRRMLALMRELIGGKRSAHVPAGVVGQVWRGSPRQQPVIRMLRTEAVRIHPLGESIAYRIGLLLAASKTADVVDAHVAILARSLSAVVLTSDPEDIVRLDATLEVVTV